MIYLDNAATTAMSEAALNAFVEVSSGLYGNPSAVYSFGRKTKKILEESRRIIADCIGADPEEIYFTSCGTESDNWVMNQVYMGKNKIITSAVEHHAVLNPAKRLATNNIDVTFLPVDNKCMVVEDELIKSLDGTPILASIMMQNNETGAIQRIRKLAKLVHDDNQDSIFHTDAVQAVGHININVKDLGIDMLSASSHKFNGPKGVGFLYVNKSYNLSPFVLGGGQENGMRSGTENVAGIYSMAKALEDNVKNMKDIYKNISMLDKTLIEMLSTEGIPYIINGESSYRAAGILNLSINGIDSEGLLNMLDMHEIYISIGSACNSKSQERSHVLTAMRINDEQIDSSVRISIGRYNTEDEIKTLVKWIAKYYKIIILSKS